MKATDSQRRSAVLTEVWRSFCLRLLRFSGGSRGCSLGQLPPNGCGDPLEWRPLIKMRPFLVPIEIETKTKLLSLNQAMLYTSLNFSIYVTDFDPASDRLESTLLLFCNNTPVPFLLFRVWTAHCPAITSTISFASTVLNLPSGCAKLVCFVSSFLMFGGSFESKSSSEDRKAINWKT